MATELEELIWYWKELQWYDPALRWSYDRDKVWQTIKHLEELKKLKGE